MVFALSPGLILSVSLQLTYAATRQILSELLFRAPTFRYVSIYFGDCSIKQVARIGLSTKAALVFDIFQIR